MEENTPNEHSFWLCLKPEVYYVRKQNRVLLYNTETGDCKQSDDSAAVAFLEKSFVFSRTCFAYSETFLDFR